MGHLSKLLRDNCADLSRVPVELFVKAVLLDCGLSPRIAMTPEKLCVVLREATPEVTSLVEGPHEIMDRLAEEIRSKLPPTAEHPSDASPPEVNTSEPDRTVITTGGGASVTVPTRCPECECYQVRATFISGELRSVRCARPECDWRTLHGKAAKGGVGCGVNDNDDNEPTILMGIRLDARSWVEIARDKPPVDIKTDLAAIEGKILHAPPLVMSEEQHRRWGYILGSDEMDRGAGD